MTRTLNDTQPVMSEANAPIPAVQSGAVAWRYRQTEEHDWEYEDHSPQHTPWAVRRMRATAFPHYEALYLAAPQSEPLPGGVGEADVRLLMKARSAIEAGLATLNGLGAKAGGRISLMATTSAEITTRLAALSGKEQG